MGDLIRREELLASQFVHTECFLKENKDRHLDVYKKGWNDALQAVHDNTPAVDAIEVVRCKDCKHYKENDGCGWLDYEYVQMMKPEDFCSYGERKVDG